MLFDYFSKAVQNRIIRDFDIQCVIAPKGTEHNGHHYLLEEITKIARSTKTCRYLGFCQWSEAERDTGSNVLSMVNEFQKCSNGNWIEGVTGKDPRKQRDCKLKKFQQEVDHTDSLLKLLISCRSLAEGVDLKNVHGCILFPIHDRVKLKLNKSLEDRYVHYVMKIIMHYHGINKLLLISSFLCILIPRSSRI